MNSKTAVLKSRGNVVHVNFERCYHHLKKRLVPIEERIYNENILSLVKSQFSEGTKLFLELVYSSTIENLVSQEYRVYHKEGGEKIEPSSIDISRFTENGEVMRYMVSGSLFFDKHSGRIKS